MIDKTFAERFAAEWIDAWNHRDVERVLAHYADDFTMHSPIIIQFYGEPTGKLQGKDKVRAYWTKALQSLPDLRFELISTLIGVDSLTVYYKGARDRLVAEVFHFGTDRQVTKAYAHYAV